MKIKLLIGVGIAGAAMAYAAKDPVIMTVNGVDVPLSEFEYLYHKNSQQQIDPQPLADYVEMFKIYKLKVADALAAGIDTTSQFRRDMIKYRHELAEPYITDSTYIEKMAREQYGRMGEELEARHIMIVKRGKADAVHAQHRLADSLYNVIAGGGNFEELAAQYSQDRMSKDRGGNMGFMAAGMLPYSFEKKMYSLTEGEISEVIETSVGYHILKGGKRRPSSGSVLASHILLMVGPKGGPEADAVAKAKADSLYKVVAADPSQFAEIARKYSDDKGSGQQGGLLPWFSVGQMVPEFSDAAFALKNGEISEPVRSQFGYHIIYRKDHKDLAPYQEIRNSIIAKVTNANDRERKAEIQLSEVNRLGKKHKIKVNKSTVDMLNAKIKETGSVTGEFDDFLKNGNLELFTIGKNKYGIEGLRMYIYALNRVPTDNLAGLLEQAVTMYECSKLLDAEREYLYDHNADYRNLLNEYRDGSLLYEVSLQKVWDKASKDEEGLKNYFEQHRDDFKWTEPRVKGILVKAVNDSVAALVSERLPKIGNDTIVSTIRKEFGKDVQIDRVLVKKGDNPLVDYLVFDPANSSAPLSANYPVYFMYNNEVIAEPREVDDVKGVVTAAYQDFLEQQWVEELKGKYPVVVNEKTLKKVK